MKEINYTVGEYVFVLALLKFCKIKSVTNKQSTVTICFDSNGNEYIASALHGSNMFASRGFKAKESKIWTIEDIIQFFGWVSLIVVVLYFADKIFMG